MVKKATAQKKQLEKPAKRGAPAGKAQRKSGAKKPPRRGRPSTRPSVAKIIKRNRDIVLMHTGRYMSFTAISKELGVSEKTAREGYAMYIREIAPLVDAEDALEKAHEYLLKMEGITENLGAIYTNSDDDRVKIKALMSIMETMWREIELRQSLGLMPHKLGELQLVGEIRYVAEQVITLFRQLNAPPEVFRELQRIMSSEPSRN